ncbi:MAG: SpoIID/LytB domain-containing protein [Prolixibacteraceae bacterium]|jgi:stage II sporulation protein D|nr:SpoIID/LytB domain-containing protein [Prolixibacteraceae bacterium]
MILQTEPSVNVGIALYSLLKFELKGNFLFNGKPVEPGLYEALIESGLISTQFSTGSKKINLKPENGNSTFVLKEVTIGIGFHWEKHEDQEFEGELTMQFENGKIRVVNKVLLETYLKSVISSEMSAMNDPELLKTHAIVSRSWLLAQIVKSDEKKQVQKSGSQVKTDARGEVLEITKWYDREDHETFDVCADDHCQRYQGITKVISENAQKAVEDTRGGVLAFDGEICDARYSKCCGGISEDFSNVWQPVDVPYLTAVRDLPQAKPADNFDAETFIRTSPDSFCKTNDAQVLKQVLVDFDRSTHDFYRWKIEYSQEELSALIKQKSGIDFGEIHDLVPLERGKSWRIIRLKIVGAKRTIVVGKELEIRKWLSVSHLYSSAFVVNCEFEDGSDLPARFILHGAGWGHGAGMCQIGAAVMCRKGYQSEEILRHYYPGAGVQLIYD